eukprot:8551256-Alexandrium_andersonii.AAC.1
MPAGAGAAPLLLDLLLSALLTAIVSGGGLLRGARGSTRRGGLSLTLATTGVVGRLRLLALAALAEAGGALGLRLPGLRAGLAGSVARVVPAALLPH